MITKNDLEQYKTFIDPYQIEKDYLQDLILYNIYKTTKNAFVFKGGTALSKVYHTDRFSEDLDFTLQYFNDFNNLGTDKEKMAYIKLTLNKSIKSIEYKIEYVQQSLGQKSTILISEP